MHRVPYCLESWTSNSTSHTQVKIPSSFLSLTYTDDWVTTAGTQSEVNTFTAILKDFIICESEGVLGREWDGEAYTYTTKRLAVGNRWLGDHLGSSEFFNKTCEGVVERD